LPRLRPASNIASRADRGFREVDFSLNKFAGSICALATPFRGDSLDLDSFGALIDYQIAAGTQGIVVAGSTGEAHALDDSEYDRLVAFAVERIAQRITVLAGTGTANTRKTTALTRRMSALGVNAALVVTPYYVRPTQEGLRRHFTDVAEHGGLPVVLYNVPTRTGCDLLPETVAKLASHTRIVGIKEARSEVERMDALVALKSANFRILSGDDPTCMRAMLAGADGVIAVSSNAAPAAFRQLCDASLAGDSARANTINETLTALYAVLGVEPNPIPVKWCLQELGLGSGEPRLPLLALSPSQRTRVAQVLADLHLSVQRQHSSAA
jgi:4-hydroxy-tetrahydrodipicolinate synthase